MIDGATAHGATDVNGVSFELADPVKAQNDARAAAVAAARVSAEAMATAGHVSLGAVVSITDATPVQSPIFYNDGAPAGRGRWRDDPGQAGHPGPRRERDRGLRHRLTPRHRARAYERVFASLISMRCPSGSRKKARISQSDSTGSVRKSAPRSRSVANAARQSGTRIVIA